MKHYLQNLGKLINRSLNFFTFCNYYFFKNKRKESGRALRLSVSISLSLLWYLKFLICYGLCQIYFDINPGIYIPLFFLVIILLYNYLYFFPKRSFLKYDFKLSTKYVIILFGYIILLFCSYLFVSKINRERKFSVTNELSPTGNKPKSLEEDIRQWFNS